MGALALYDLVDINTQHASTRAEMDLRRGRVYLELGDTENAYEQFAHSVETYPESYNSYSAMLALLDAEIEIDDLQQGIVYFNAGEYIAAIEAFDRHLIGEPEHAGEPHYFKALAYRSLGNYGTAQTEFREIIDTHPEDSLWENSLDRTRSDAVGLGQRPGGRNSDLRVIRRICPGTFRHTEYSFSGGSSL